MQDWDVEKNTFISKSDQHVINEPDVVYDSLLANQCIVDDPEVMDGAPGETILLRFIAASAFVNWFLDLGELKGSLLAMDANPVESISGHVFQLVIAQRLALRVPLPTNPGVYPIIARAERSNDVMALSFYHSIKPSLTCKLNRINGFGASRLLRSSASVQRSPWHLMLWITKFLLL